MKFTSDQLAQMIDFTAVAGGVNDEETWDLNGGLEIPDELAGDRDEGVQGEEAGPDLLGEAAGLP